MASPQENTGTDAASSSMKTRQAEAEGTAPPPEGGTLNPTVISASPADAISTLPPSVNPPQILMTGSAGVSIGSAFGPYQLLDKLGEGGMGAVYKGRHQHLDMLVAIKVLPQQFTQQPQAVARFKREMKAVGRIRHPNIVQAMDAGEIDGTHFLAMEYIEGSDLAKLVAKKGLFSPANACKAIKQAAQALAAAHQAGLVHRDIKPSNLLLAKSGQIKILDLGLALLGEEGGHSGDVTAHGQTFGTPDYMAPEQWADSHRVDARTDLYALGCTLYFLLVGRALYSDENHRTPFNKMNGHVNEPAPDLKAARADVPDGLVAIYQKLVAKSPDARYQTAAELIEDLNRFAAGKTISDIAMAPMSAAQSTAAPGTGTEVASQSDLTRVSGGIAVKTAEELPSIGSGTADELASTVQLPRKRSSGKSARSWGLLIGGPAAMAGLFGLLLIWLNRPPADQVPSDGPLAVEKSATESFTPPGPLASPPAGWHGWPADAPKPAIAPFDAAQAKKYQEEWAAYLKVPVEWENSIGMKFRLIPPGEFWMGVTKEDAEAIIAQHPDEDTYQLKEKWLSSAPRHKVALTQAFYLAITEVTQEQYEKAVGENPSSFSANGEFKDRVAGNDTSQHPVTMVSLVEGARFCIALSQQERLQQAYSSKSDTVARSNGNGYCLPSEAEWEYACRAGTDTHWFSGDDESKLATAAWYGERYTTSPVGLLRSNPFGLYDMHGNAWEACHELDPIVYRRRGDGLTVDPPKSASMEMQALRGGNHWFDASYCRSGFHNYTPSQPYPSGGLRVSLSVEAVRQSLNARANSTWHGWPADAPKPAIAPFDAAQAKKHQDEWAAYLKVPVEYTNSIGMKFRLIPPGEFLMGSTPEEIEAAIAADGESSLDFWRERIQSEAPQRKAIVNHPFYLCITEVTQAQYEKVEGSNPSFFASSGPVKEYAERVAGMVTASHPVDGVSWEDAVIFCARLSQQELLEPLYSRADGKIQSKLDGDGYRLPLEKEWEFSCRAGTTTRFWFGDDDSGINDAGWNKGKNHTFPVSRLNPNPFGLYDTCGNVFEWVQDSWDSLSEPLTVGSTLSQPGTMKVVRGGAYGLGSWGHRSTSRSYHDQAYRIRHMGMRPALTVDAVRQSLKVTGPSIPNPEKTTFAAPAGWHGWPADAPKPAIAPFDAAQAKKHQEEWAAYLKVPVEWKNSLGMKFRLIPPGEFLMGSTAEEVEALLHDPSYADQRRRECTQAEAPQHKVILTQPIFLGTHEVLRAEYEQVMGTGSAAADPADKAAGLPIENVSWHDCAEFCVRLSQQETWTPAYSRTENSFSPLAGNGYRLPSEAEWEYACRAGSLAKYATGDRAEDLARVGWYDRNSEMKLHPAGQLAANPFGLADMHGNLWEWVQDGWDPAFYAQFQERPAIDPGSPFSGSSQCVMRGGSWGITAAHCRSANRYADPPEFKHAHIGFRVAVPVDTVQQALQK